MLAQVQDGTWDRGVPVGGGDRGDPATDFDGSGQCFLTENDPLDSNSDVDAGCTELISPPLDISGGGSLIYSYWIDSGPGSIIDDFLRIDVATDDPPTNWKVVRTYTSPAPAWQTDALDFPGADDPLVHSLQAAVARGKTLTRARRESD